MNLKSLIEEILNKDPYRGFEVGDIVKVLSKAEGGKGSGSGGIGHVVEFKKMYESQKDFVRLNYGYTSEHWIVINFTSGSQMNGGYCIEDCIKL